MGEGEGREEGDVVRGRDDLLAPLGYQKGK